MVVRWWSGSVLVLRVCAQGSGARHLYISGVRCSFNARLLGTWQCTQSTASHAEFGDDGESGLAAALHNRAARGSATLRSNVGATLNHAEGEAGGKGTPYSGST
jgi:hypothetical protein